MPSGAIDLRWHGRDVYWSEEKEAWDACLPEIASTLAQGTQCARQPESGARAQWLGRIAQVVYFSLVACPDMQLMVADEFSELRRVAVCWGDHVPEYGTYTTEDPEFLKFHHRPWNKDLLLRQQEQFFKRLEEHGAELVFPRTDRTLPWQMYARDVGFVVGSRLHFAGQRTLGDRQGEIDLLLDALNLDTDGTAEVSGRAEGGDVLVRGANSVYVGISSRTSPEAVESLSTRIAVRAFFLGETVMHLDTRLTLLPNHVALIYPGAFSGPDLKTLQARYRLIAVSKEEADALATNVLCVNPETVFVPQQHQRIAHTIREHGFCVELLDYTEPIALGGSFRCTTLPLVRT